MGSFVNMGAPVIDGTLQTATGLVSVGASPDSTLRAHDAESGNLLWQTKLPFSGHATPMTYRLSSGTKQYLVIATGGATGIDVDIGDSLVALTLPT